MGRSSALHAAEMGSKAIVRLLLGRGKVAVDARDGDGRTPRL